MEKINTTTDQNRWARAVARTVHQVYNTDCLCITLYIAVLQQQLTSYRASDGTQPHQYHPNKPGSHSSHEPTTQQRRLKNSQTEQSALNNWVPNAVRVRNINTKQYNSIHPYS